MGIFKIDALAKKRRAKRGKSHHGLDEKKAFWTRARVDFGRLAAEAAAVGEPLELHIDLLNVTTTFATEQYTFAFEVCCYACGVIEHHPVFIHFAVLLLMTAHADVCLALPSIPSTAAYV